MRNLKKSPFTLLEVLLAFLLLSLVLSALFFFQYQVIRNQERINVLEEEQFLRLYLSERLHQTLGKAKKLNNESKGVFFLYPFSNLQLGESLFFTFDNGVDLDKSFSNIVLGRLFLSPEKKLMLAIFPLKEGEGRAKVEVLAEEISSLSFSFFTPPFTKEAKLEKGGWNEGYQKEEKGLPALVSIRIERKRGGEVTLCIPLIYANEPILYKL